MADSAAFDWLCEQLEQRSALDRLESRGTVRLALKQAGLEARSVTAEQLRVLLERLMPAELEARGIDAPQALCDQLVRELARADLPAPDGDTPDEVFRRLGGTVGTRLPGTPRDLDGPDRS